jgi:hypothetical protein
MSILSDEQLTRHRAGLLALACLQAFFTSGIFYGQFSPSAIFEIGVAGFIRLWLNSWCLLLACCVRF